MTTSIMFEKDQRPRPPRPNIKINTLAQPDLTPNRGGPGAWQETIRGSQSWPRDGPYQ